MISPEEYMKDEEEFKILSPDEYMGTGVVPSVLSPEQYRRGLTKPRMEEQSFIAKHPNLYGAFGVAQALIPYIQYIDPAERERFAKLSTQKQTRELLLQNLEAIAMVAAPAITKGLIPLVAKYMPKTYKAFKFIKTPIKEMGELRRTPAKEVAARVFAPPTPKPIPKAKIEGIVQRIEEPGVKRATFDKPHGIYTTPIEYVSPHAELKGKTYLWRKNPKANVLEVDASGLVTTNRGLVGESGGIAGLRKLVPKNEFERLLKLSKEELKIDLSSKYPKIKWDKYYDQQEMLEGYAGILARKRGYDAINAIDKTAPEFTEYIGLTEKSLTPISAKIKPIVVPEPKPLAEVPEPVIQKVTAAIKEAKPIRKVQEQIYSKERAKRLGRAMAVGEKIPGERGFIAQLRQLKGELNKVEFQSIRAKVTQKDVDDLFKIIHRSQEVRGFQNLMAKKGLAKLFGQLGGRVPTEGELVLLRKIFPADFIQTLLKKRPLFQQMGEAGLQLANIPRSIMSSFDLSAPLRQGLFLSIAHPRRFMQSFVKMFRQFGSEKAYMAMQESIALKRTFQLMQESGLALTELGKGLFMREERFMSQWAERIPGLIGRGVRASGRAYTGFLNKLRADVFEDLVLKAERAGLNPQNNMDLTKQIARFINLASGRGGLGSLEGSAKILNTFFFSPRLMASRLTLLNPVYYIKADPFVRKEALKSLFALAGAAGTILAMAKAGGLQVSLDPRTADFLKIKIGNTRIDVLGGFQQYMRAAGQLISGQYISSTTGKLVTLGEGYKPLTRLDIAYRQIETKEAPIFSFITALMKGQDVKGEPISIPKEIAERFKPMALSDIYEIAKEDPWLLPISFISMFGVGLQTYKGRPRKIKGGFKAIKGR